MIDYVIRAPQYELDPERLNRSPVIFLAGPIQGVQDWQEEAMHLIDGHERKVIVANPRRREGPGAKFDKDKYVEQLAWEEYYLNYAGTAGAVIFWGAGEEKASFWKQLTASSKPNTPQVQLTKLEKGDFYTYPRSFSRKLSVGIEEGYIGGKEMRLSLARRLPHLEVFSRLEETCKRAVDLCYQK